MAKKKNLETRLHSLEITCAAFATVFMAIMKVPKKLNTYFPNSLLFILNHVGQYRVKIKKVFFFVCNKLPIVQQHTVLNVSTKESKVKIFVQNYNPQLQKVVG